MKWLVIRLLGVATIMFMCMSSSLWIYSMWGVWAQIAFAVASAPIGYIWAFGMEAYIAYKQGYRIVKS